MRKVLLAGIAALLMLHHQQRMHKSLVMYF